MSSMLASVLGGEGAMAGKTLYLRALPEVLVREAKATAARRGITLAALVSEALQWAVGSEAGPAPATTASGRPRRFSIRHKANASGAPPCTSRGSAAD